MLMRRLSLRPVRLYLNCALIGLFVLTALVTPATAQQPADQSRFGAMDTNLGLDPAAAFSQPDQHGALQQGAVCTELLFNPSINSFFGWTELARTVNYATDTYYSFPAALTMIEDFDGIVNVTTNTDLDAFGQQFRVPSDVGSLRLRYALAFALSPATGTPDTLFFELFPVNPFTGEPDYSQVYYSRSYTPPGDGQWTVQSFEIPSETVDVIRGKPVWLIISTATDQRDPVTQFWLDDIQITACPGEATPGGSIGGRVTLGGGAPQLAQASEPGTGGVQLALAYFAPDGSSSIIDYTVSDSEGNFRFDGVAALPPGAAYQVWYINAAGDNSRLSFWADRLISAFPAGTDISDINFDIANIALDGDVALIDQQFPYTFSWQSRGIAGDRYVLCFYDLQNNSNQACSSELQTSTNLEVSATDLINAGGFDFAYNRPYGWYVVVVGPEYNPGIGAALGYSFAANSISFSDGDISNQPIVPIGSPQLRSGAAWTVMVYMAGDNDLSDPSQPDNLRSQFDSLSRLAADYPQINVVVLSDFRGNNDSRFCQLTAAGPRCDNLGEVDSADPATLRDFIQRSLQDYPAERTMLIISSHGHSLYGVATDYRSRSDLEPDEVRQAFQEAGLGPGNKIDLLYYNNCLMGSLEAAFTARDFAEFLVASPNVSWAIDVYPELFKLFDATLLHTTDSHTMAAGVVEAHRRTMESKFPGLAISIAAYNLAQTSALRTSLSQLAAQLDTDRTVAEQVRLQVQRYDSSYDNRLDRNDSWIDVGHLAELLAAEGSGASEATRDSAQQLLAALNGDATTAAALIANVQVSGASSCDGNNYNLANARGLSIYFPENNDQGELGSYLAVYDTYAAENDWDEFIQAGINRSQPLAAPRKPAAAPIGLNAFSCNNNTQVWLPLVLAQS